MQFLLYSVFVLLIVVLYQDQKKRAIWWFLPPLIFLCGMALTYPNFNWVSLLSSVIFICVLIASLYGYIYVRFRNLDLFKTYFGLGDLLILIAIVPFFEFREYVFFFTVATFASLIIYVLASLIKKQQTVPYAGYLALVFGVHLAIKHWLNLSFMDLIDA